VGSASWVDVADGGNQTIVGVGVAVSVGARVAVGTNSRGRQAARERSPLKRKKICDLIKE
jgi:hypothetical protein